MKKIIHIDMDCFYAAVEMRDHPEYRTLPLAVGGNERRGVLSTCNYKAREFGLHSAMPTAQALKLCPELVVVPGRMAVYKAVSQQIQTILRRYTQIIEPLSLDEAFLDVTGSPLHQGSATWIAQAIRQDIAQELQLTASAGVAPIKFLAKIASDMNKPNGLCVITPEQMQTVIDQLPLGKIPGVGKVNLAKLHSAGFYVGKDIKQADYRELLRQFGTLGASLWKKSHGIDDNPVQVARERKSIGVELTFSYDIFSYQQAWQILSQQLYPTLEQRLTRENRGIIKQGIKIKFADFQQSTIESTTTQLALADFAYLLKELLGRQKGRGIRLLGLNVALQPKAQDEQLSLLVADPSLISD